MIIKRIKYSVVFIIMFFSWANLAYASLEITEINYNPPVKTNHLWIKIYNNTSDEVNLTEWSVADYDGTSWHYHAINTDGASTLASNSYAIVAKASSSTINDFKNKNPDISDLLFYGNLTIENEGTLGLSKDKKTVISNKSYGGTNISSIDNSSTDNTISNNVGGTTPTSKPVEISKITTKIVAPKIVTAGVPFVIDHTTTGVNKEKVILGKFIWNFGDGMKKEGSTSDPFEYIYEYPGEYVLTLSYSDSPFDTKPDAIDRLTIKVIPSGVVISSVGTYADSFVEIENNSSYEMSLNKWILKGSVHSFVIPEGTVILPNKKLKLSPKITGFDFNDLSSISIIDTSGQVFATYPQQKTYSIKNYSTSNSQGNIVKADIVASDQVAGIANSPDVINLNDLGASAVGAGSKGSANNVLNNKTLIYLGLAGIIIIGIVSVVLIRRKADYPDYMEKEISAKDMTIME